MNAFQLLLHSKAFWTAVISAVGLVALKYLHVPEDIWGAVFGILVVVISVFTVEDAGAALGRGIAREMRKIDQERKVSLEDKG